MCCVTADQPVEQCDDGNQIEDDECGNDCEINCRRNADCPEGACVDGQCVNQCVDPDDDDDPDNDDGGDGGDPVSNCPDAYPLCRENDPIVNMDNPPCPNNFRAEMSSTTGCGQTNTGTCYRCVPNICPAIPAECQSFCSKTFCTTGCCGKDPATGQCGCNAMPTQQGSLPMQENFLTRLMAQQVPGVFNLLP